ncbi:MAG: L(+)-tartrate dehydratase subunit alpha [Peptococcaceae bacterium]|nr:L(+)-tartrate dehydratase subunit alpha [Peptococcaceae bacterium]
MRSAESMQIMTNTMAKFIDVVGKRLPDDIVGKLSELRATEDSPLAKAIYDSMFDNLAKAAELDRPICQDTGVISFFVKAGAKFPLLASLNGILVESVRIATTDSPLRHNAVQIFDEVNTNDNIGEKIPYVHWEIVDDGDEVEIEIYMAGGGGSLPGRAITLMPSAGYEGIVKYVFDTMVDWGINACPPLLIGIGIAGSAEIAAILSKKAILRPIGTAHPNPKGAEFEKLMEKGLNELGIGPQGLTGNSTVMGVHVESAARHPSSLSVGLSVGCWAHRRGTIRLKKDNSYEIKSHAGVAL